MSDKQEETELLRWIGVGGKSAEDTLSRIIAERDAAIHESNRRDKKWMDGIRAICKANISFDGLTDDGPGQYAMTLDRFIGKLVAERDAARAEADAYRPIIEAICVHGTTQATDSFALTAVVKQSQWYATADALNRHNGDPHAN